MNLLKYLCFLFLAITSFQTAEASSSFWEFLIPNQFQMGPEVYHIKRIKEGGSEQSGWLYGGRIRIQHISPCQMYWGFDAFKASGKPTGHSASGTKIYSKFREGQLEGRLGYSFLFTCCKPIQLTPYIGYGVFYGRNFFIQPTSYQLHFHNRFEFISTGFLSNVNLNDRFKAGVNFKVKFTQNGRSKVTHDPGYPDITLEMQDEWQYEVDLPILYANCCRGRLIEATFEPFYRFRHYGGMPNYPYDFYETKFHIYGARFLLRLLF